MWYRFAVAPIPLINPIEGGFWVDDVPIGYGETKSVREWSSLLQTARSNINNQEKLNEFLSDPKKFEIKDGKKIYLRNKQADPKPLVIPFTFYINGEEILKGRVFQLMKLSKLLQTNPKKINKQEKLNEFLNESNRFKIEDGKKIYLRNTQADPKPLVIPFTFYIDGEEILKGRVFPINHLRKLLQTAENNIKPQEKLNEFLNDSRRFEIKDGKKIYLRNTHNLSSDLIIPFTFYVNGEEILKGSVFPLSYLWKLLQTNYNKINKQEKLNEFLSDPRRFEIKDGAYFYKPIKISNKESQFISKFNNYNKDSIYINSQFKIRIFYKSEQNFNINKILKLDFAFMKNDKIVLAIEINGAQHYGFVPYNKDYTFNQWQDGLNNDILKINYCHDNNIPLLIFHHMLSDEEFKSILNNLYENPHIYDQYIPQLVIDNNVADVSLEFIKRQIYSHLYPVFKGVISFDDDISKKRYIKDTLILIAKLLGIYNGGIDKTDYIRSFNANVDLTENYNICLDIYNNLYPDYPLDRDDKITYSDLSKKPTIQKPKEIEQDPLDN